MLKDWCKLFDSGNMEAIEELIKDQDINAVDNDGTTALHEAALSGNEYTNI